MKKWIREDLNLNACISDSRPVGVIVDKVIKFQIPSDAGNFLTRLSTVIF
jgi:hypothetical protein